MNVRAIHVVPSIGEEASGPSYSVPRLCQALAAVGVDVNLHVLARGVSLPWGSLAIHQHPEWPGIFNKLGVSPAMCRALMRESRNDAALLHSHGLWMMPNVYPGYVVARTRSRLVTSPHGALGVWARKHSKWKKRLMWALLQRRTLLRTDCFHATCESEYECIRAANLRAPVAVIPSGIEILPLPAPPAGPSRRLVFFGRLHAVKGLDILLRSWTAVSARFPEWELHIIGPDDGGYGRRMQALATRLRTRRVVFRGAIYGNDKWRELSAASLFVLPSHGENFGLAVAEALAIGVPAIVTRGAPWEGLDREKCGWWIDQGVDSLTACLEKALAVPTETLRTMGLRGREWMTRDFSWLNVGDMMARTYDWLHEGGASPEWVRTN